MIFTNNATFIAARFIDNANFSKASFTNVDFQKALFAGKTNFNMTDFIEKADFRQVNFKKPNFIQAIFRKIDIPKVDFINTTFKSDADFSNANFTEEANFNMTNFNKCKFSRAIFNKKANFEKAKFKGEANFKYVVFTKRANFNFTVFKKEADFKFSFFNFEKEKENDSNSFFYATFEDRGAFYDITLLGTLYFDKINMEDKTNIYFGKTKCPKIVITNTIINGRIDLRDANVDKIDFKTSRVVGSGSVTNTIKNLSDKFVNWETANLFKSEEIRGVNTIKALEYKAKEKDLYQKELVRKENKSFQDVMEIASIQFSKWSNNHGQNWGRAVLFTILSGLGCFIVFSLITCFAPDPTASIAFIDFFDCAKVKTTSEKFLSSLVKFYIPINYEGITNYLKDSLANPIIQIFAIIFYLSGKIAVAYGMVEVVQAFRKLK